MLNKEYRKLLLNELRLAVIQPSPLQESNNSLLAAMTVNENLKSLGYTLTPKDIIRLSKDSSLYTFYDSIKELMDNVEAEPMYPNFPTQVMEMDEATFRFHQLIHYFSTYGLESMLGIEVSKGWLPDVASTQKNQRDTLKLKEKVIHLINEEEAYILPFHKLLAKKERLTLQEAQIITHCCQHLPIDTFNNLQIPFKENLFIIFHNIYTSCEEKEAIKILQNICQHTGDVFKCFHYSLTKKHYKLTHRDKRIIVKLIESYPVEELKANIILSLKKAQMNKTILQYLNYNKYSRSDEHKAVVKELRNGQLHSWESKAKQLLMNKDENALSFIAQRPGMMLRWVAWLIRQGYQPTEIIDSFKTKCEQLSIQTLITTLQHFGEENIELTRKEASQVYDIFYSLIKERLSYLKTPLQNKKVFIDEGMFSFKDSRMEFNTKSEEGGYIRSGLAIRIPDDVNKIRFFVYWNDKKRIDLDLHGMAKDIDGKPIHIGWNGDYLKDKLVFSGDITHSNAAEYIDIDLVDSPVAYLASTIHFYNSYEYKNKRCFKDIDTCYIGLMGVNDVGENVQLYDVANCFFHHNLQSSISDMYYGFIDVQRRLLVFVGKAVADYHFSKPYANKFNLEEYLKVLMDVQGCEVVDNRDVADIVLTLDKGQEENSLSLIDENYFMEY